MPWEGSPDLRPLPHLISVPLVTGTPCWRTRPPGWNSGHLRCGIGLMFLDTPRVEEAPSAWYPLVSFICSPGPGHHQASEHLLLGADACHVDWDGLCSPPARIKNAGFLSSLHRRKPETKGPGPRRGQACGRSEACSSTSLKRCPGTLEAA